MLRTILASTCLSLAFTAVSAQEIYNGQGYFIACGDEGCFLNVDGFNIFVDLSDGAEFLEDIPMMAAIEVTGELFDIGDSSAAIRLYDVERIRDNPYEENLIAIQGSWHPVGEDNPFNIEIYGMDWSEVLMDEVQDRFMMSVGDSCADGTLHLGMVINLYRYGDDPEADACWLLEYVDDQMMTLRNVSGDFQAINFERNAE